MSLSRRELLKAQAAGIAALAANVSSEAVAQPVTGGVDALKISWSKAPCGGRTRAMTRENRVGGTPLRIQRRIVPSETPSAWAAVPASTWPRRL